MFLEWRYSNATRYVWCKVATFYWNSQMYPLGAQILHALIWPCWLTVFVIKHSNWSLIISYNSSNIHCQAIKGLHVWAKQLAPGTCFEHLPDLLNTCRQLLKFRIKWCIKQLDHFVFFLIFMWKENASPLLRFIWNVDWYCYARVYKREKGSFHPGPFEVCRLFQ